MNNKPILLVLLICWSFCNGNNLVVSKLCELINQRTYFISRMDTIVDLLNRSKNKISVNFTIKESKFKNAIIQKIVGEFNISKKLATILDLWTDVTEYKYLDDPSFTREFALLIFVVQKNLHQNAKSGDTDNLDLAMSIAKFSYTEAITVRRYYVHRLANKVTSLKKIKCRKETLFESVDNNNNECDCTFASHYTFIHPEIKACIQSINNLNSLDPVIKLFNDFKKLKYIETSLFHKEFLLFIFSLYRNLVINNACLKKILLTRSVLETVALVYANIENIPPEQILDAIDMLSHELPKILDQYEINSNLTWQAWLEKYWWVPPVIGTGLAIRLFMIFKKNTHAQQQAT